MKIDFQDCNATGPYIEQWWHDKTDYDTADALNLTPGGNISGIDAQLAAAGAIAGTVTDTEAHPLSGICVQATTTTFVGGLAHTDSNGNYSIILSEPGDYSVQFVDCGDTPTFAAQWWNNQPSSATAQRVTVALGQTVDGIDALLVPGAPSTISGRVLNLHGIPMTPACVVAYLPNQYAIFAPVNPDGSYTVAGVPSGTYALAFLGCDGGNPAPTIPDPEATTTSYHAVWWNGVPLALDQTNNGGPDPIAQGANLVTALPGETLTGYDACFGCTAISIATIAPGDGSLTLDFTTPGLVTNTGDAQDAVSAEANPLTYTAACTSETGATSGSAEGPTSPITISGLPPGDYTCMISAADGPTVVATSAVSEVIAVPGAPADTNTPATAPTNSDPGVLAFTGSSSPTTLGPMAIALITLGLALTIAARRRRARSTS